jgi:hypothetical protein
MDQWDRSVVLSEIYHFPCPEIKEHLKIHKCGFIWRISNEGTCSCGFFSHDLLFGGEDSGVGGRSILGGGRKLHSLSN